MTESSELATSAEAEAGPIALDPFAYVQGHASRICGLGGDEPFHDPAYAFHTPYVPVNNGPAQFTLRFSNLAAKTGTLTVRIGMQPQEPGAPARLADSERITFNRLIHQGGKLSIAFEGYRNVHFALLGHIFDGTDASAEGLEVFLEQSEVDDDDGGVVVETRSTAFGADAARPVAKLISTARATFADPVSQLCTARQFAEAPYAGWARRLGEPARADRLQWERCYILQVLSRYGMMVAGARGAGFGRAGEPLPAILATAGVDVTATTDASVGEDDPIMLTSLRRPDLCDEGTFDRHVSLRSVDPSRIPNDLVNFDFVWSAGTFDALDTAQAGLNFVERTMNCLRPGGLAVHTGGFDLASNGDTVDGGGAARFRRRDMERLALMLISRGHEVAQVKLDASATAIAAEGTTSDQDDPSVTSFGIVTRRAVSRF